MALRTFSTVVSRSHDEIRHAVEGKPSRTMHTAFTVLATLSLAAPAFVPRQGYAEPAAGAPAAGIYENPGTLEAGTRLDAAAFTERLKSRGYQQVPGSPSAGGQFSVQGDAFQILARQQYTENGEYLPPLSVTYRSRTGVLENNLGPALPYLPIEPARLGALADDAAADDGLHGFRSVLNSELHTVAATADLSKLRIFTSLNPDIQSCAKRAAETPTGAPAQAVLVLSLPGRRVIAWAEHGGDTKGESLVLQAHARGNMIKPFVALTALEQKAAGTEDIRRAAEQQLGAETAKLAEQAGTAKVQEMLDQLHLDSLSLRSLAEAYGAIASFGQLRPAQLWNFALGGDGDLLKPAAVSSRPIARPDAAFLVSEFLRGAVDHGASHDVRDAGIRVALSATGGSTADNQQSWYVAFTPTLLVATWAGVPNGAPSNAGISVTKADALQVLREALSCSEPAAQRRPMPPPPGIAFAVVDRETGQLATRNCPADTVSQQAYPQAELPSTYCERHTRGKPQPYRMPATPDPESSSESSRPRGRQEPPSYRPRQPSRTVNVDGILDTIRRGANTLWRR